MDITLDTFIISDTHFGHKEVLKKHTSRLLALSKTSFMNFDDFSLHLWNQHVRENDSVLHLGDLFFNDGYKILKWLNGRKTLVVGNNDIGKHEILHDWKVIDKIKFKIKDKKEFKKDMKKKWGNSLKNPYATGLIVDIDDTRIMFSHFPVNHKKKHDKYEEAKSIIDYAFSLAQCDINIHGHLHQKDSTQPYCFNASTERLGFIPRKLRYILNDYRIYEQIYYAKC